MEPLIFALSTEARMLQSAKVLLCSTMQPVLTADMADYYFGNLRSLS